jgi:hypothetical protein
MRSVRHEALMMDQFVEGDFKNARVSANCAFVAGEERRADVAKSVPPFGCFDVSHGDQNGSNQALESVRNRDIPATASYQLLGVFRYV